MEFTEQLVGTSTTTGLKLYRVFKDFHTVNTQNEIVVDYEQYFKDINDENVLEDTRNKQRYIVSNSNYEGWLQALAYTPIASNTPGIVDTINNTLVNTVPMDAPFIYELPYE